MIRSFNTARSTLTVRSLSFAALLATPLFVTAVAKADVTCGDTTCAKGFACETYDSAVCPAIADINGKSIDCTPTIAYACVPATCSSNADCGDDMVCYASTSSICSGGASAPACDPAAPDCGVTLDDVAASCESQTRQQCTPRYQLPCRAASDCGGGFTCEEVIETSCMGSGGATSVGSAGVGTATPTTSRPTAPSGSGAATSTGGAAAIWIPEGGVGAATNDIAQPEPTEKPTTDVAMPSPPECTTVASGRFQCVLQTINCSADADCPAGLTCVSSSSASCWASKDGTRGCTAPETVSTCQPKYYGSRDYGTATTANGSVDSTGTPTPTTPAVDKSGGEAAHADDGATAAPSDAGNVSGGGCSIAQTAPRSFGSLLMLMLTLGLGSRLRRRSTHA